MDKLKEPPKKKPNECINPACSNLRDPGMAKCWECNKPMSIGEFMRKQSLQGRPIPKLPEGEWVLLERAISEPKPGLMPVLCAVCRIDATGKRGWYKLPGLNAFACPPCHDRGKERASESSA